MNSRGGDRERLYWAAFCARYSAQRLRVASAIRARPSALILRFTADGLPDCSLNPAQRFCCDAAMRRLVASLTTRFGLSPPTGADATPLPPAAAALLPSAPPELRTDAGSPPGRLGVILRSLISCKPLKSIIRIGVAQIRSLVTTLAPVALSGACSDATSGPSFIPNNSCDSSIRPITRLVQKPCGKHIVKGGTCSLQPISQSHDGGDGCLEIRALAIHHIPAEPGVAVGKFRIVRHSGGGSQGLSYWVFAVSGELMAVSFGVCQHDRSRQGHDLARIVMRANHMQIVHMSHERRITRAASASGLRARSSGQSNELLCNRLDQRHTGNRRDLRWKLEGFSQERYHRPLNCRQPQRPGRHLDLNLGSQDSLSCRNRRIGQLVESVAARISGFAMRGILRIKLRAGIQQSAGNSVAQMPQCRAGEGAIGYDFEVDIFRLAADQAMRPAQGRTSSKH